MGEVWRARDTRLDRTVAIKVIPAEFAASASRRTRFEREARTISSLSHPNICALFDVGHDQGMDYLVMELLEGESLADRLARGPLPMPDVLRIGTQIADALAAAHRHGVVHRDLKPANVMLSRTGAKLVDFGLAKNYEATPAPDSSQATEQKPLTEEGAIIGTFQYMAPEQLEGRQADARTDIFALGAVIYEMTTGVRAFSGTNRPSLIAAIVSGEPRSISELQPAAPPSLERLLRACLEKDPDRRFQSAHDVAIELRWTEGGEASAPVPSRRSTAAWVVAVILGAALIAGAIYHLQSSPPQRDPIRFTIPPPALMNFSRTVAISLDGRKIAFRAGAFDAAPQLWVRSLDSIVTRPLRGTESATFVFWAPDGRHLGFFAGNALRRMDTNDGSIRVLSEGLSPLAGGATWNGDGVIVFSPRMEAPLHRISAEGGEQVPVTTMEGSEKHHAWPWFLPDGRHFLYSVFGTGDSNGIYVGALDSKIRKRIVPFGPLPEKSLAIFGDGVLYYLRGNELVAQKFDLNDLEVRGPVTVVDDDIEQTGPARVPISVSENGTLVYRKAGAVSIDTLSIVDRAGQTSPVKGRPAPVNRISVSRDGKSVLVSYAEPLSSVWLVDLDRGTETRMTFEDWATLADWVDPDTYAYSAAVDTPPNLFLKRPHGDPVRLTNAPRQHYLTDVTADGRFAVFNTDEEKTGLDIFMVPLSPPGPIQPLIVTGAGELNGRVSPDGRWLAYESRESGAPQIFVTPFPTPGRKWQISTSTGITPVWSGDGRELYYVDPASDQLMAVTTSSVGDALRPGKPQVLFPVSSVYDAMPDGRFIIATPRLNPDSPHLTVIAP